ncbi:MAG: T9SS type A sorting domain-containing protein [candidate division Zixibacteria bacterium]|nr:T9SS type A sorting domain-containing protein [candidate division Zixibacteria bacterium]
MKEFQKISVMIFIAVIILNVNLIAQAPDTSWTRLYGRDSDDYAYTILQTADDNYIVGGKSYSGSETGFDAYLLKLDENGDTIWTNTFGGSQGEIIYSMVEGSDDGYVAAGMIGSTTDARKAYIVKVDELGDTVWTTSYPSSRNAVAHYISRTSDDGYIVTGEQVVVGRYWEVFILKLAQDGSISWFNTFGGSGTEEGHCIEQTSDGGYITCGLTTSFGAGSTDLYLIKTDELGEAVWTRTFGGELSDAAHAVAQTPDSGYIVAGEIDNPNHGVYAVKTDAFGDTLWTRTYTNNSDIDVCTSMDLTSDGGYVFGGYTNVPGYNHDFYFVKANADGDSLWAKTIGHLNYDRGRCVKQTSDGGYILVGEAPGQAYDCYIVKLDEDHVGIDEYKLVPDNYKVLSNYPNPFNASTTISFAIDKPQHVSLKVYDIMGQEIKTLINTRLDAGMHSIKFDASDLASGFYLYKLETGEFTECSRMLLLK